MFCPFNKTIRCDTSFPYRTLDGSCNNLGNLWWGQAETPYKRLMEPDYADSITQYIQIILLSVLFKNDIL